MKISNTLSSQKIYVFAVSGGVDSVTLLDMHANRTDITIIVAHFNHGIREDADKDADFVRQLAENYKLTYMEEKQQLGQTASEEQARNARYKFLDKVKKQYKADMIVTAHHADDVVETMILNIIRGTGWKGLCSLRDTATVRRPLLEMRKSEITNYAHTHHLSWREDATNQETLYTRNYIRHHIIPKINHDEWYQLYRSQGALLNEIEKEVSQLTSYKRYDYIMWSSEVAIEMLRSLTSLTYPQAARALLAIKTAKPNAKIEVGNKTQLRFTRDSFIVETMSA